MSNLEIAKYNMIEQQIRPCDVINQTVLDTINALNRHEFVPEQYQGLAYADCQIPLADSEIMMKPLIEAKILQALAITEDENCLEIGTGSGYLTACLSKLGMTVHTIEINDKIQQLAKDSLSNLSNISFENADAFATVSGNKQYKVIVVTGAVHTIPDSFKQALSIGGRMFIIVGETPAMQALLVTRTENNTWATTVLFETDINLLG